MFNLRKAFEGAVAQVNPMDGGKTFQSVNRPMLQARRALPMAPIQRQEDDALVPGTQGLNPMNADVGHMRGVMQPSNARAEDDYTLTDALQPVNYGAPQTSLHGAFLQGNPMPVQGYAEYLQRYNRY